MRVEFRGDTRTDRLIGRSAISFRVTPRRTITSPSVLVPVCVCAFGNNNTCTRTSSRKLKTRVSHFYRPGRSQIYCGWTRSKAFLRAFSIVSKPRCGLRPSPGVRRQHGRVWRARKEDLVNFFFPIRFFYFFIFIFVICLLLFCFFFKFFFSTPVPTPCSGSLNT